MSHDQTLQAFIEKEEIAEVIHAYCFHFDRAEAEAVVALFTEDAVIDYGPEVPPMSGKAALGPMIERGLSDLFAATSHHVSNIVVRLTGADAATSVCYLYAWHKYRDRAETGELWGQYHHQFRRTAEGWKIARLRLCAAGTENFHRARMHPIGGRDRG